MGAESKRNPPLPAATESLSEETASILAPTDLATDVSRRTDHTSYSIPEDGTSLTLPIKKIRAQKSNPADSQTSLLIEYFEASRSGDKSRARPSVRVKVTPHARKSRGPDAVHITEIGKDRKASHTRRISLGSKSHPKAIEGTEISHSSGSNVSNRPPIEVEVLNNSDISNDSRTRHILPTSDISSMPGDSMLDAPVTMKAAERQRSYSPEPSPIEGAEVVSTSLKPPAQSHERSLSTERIVKRAMDKVREEQLAESAGASSSKLQKRRTTSTINSKGEDDIYGRSPRSSRSTKDYDDVRMSGDSSYLRPREADSNLSGVSSNVSLSNNPKLLKTVEDVVRRLILPEIQDLKRQQSNRSSKYDRDSYATESDFSRSAGARGLEGRHSAPSMKPKLTLSRDEHDPGSTIGSESTRPQKNRRSSRDSVTSSRRSSVDSIAKEKERIHRERDRARTRGADSPSTGLTAAALKSHNSRSTIDSVDREQRERRKKRSKSHARSESTTTNDEFYVRNREIPPLPLNSEIADSEMTRTSLLSADTQEDDVRPTAGLKELDTPIKEVARYSPRNVALPDSRPATRTSNSAREVTASPASQRSRGDREVRNQKSDRSIASKARARAFSAAGLGSAGAALYGHDTRSQERLREEARSASRTQSPSYRASPLGNRKATSAVEKTSQSRDIRPNMTRASKDSLASSLEQYPMTQKRHKGINMETENEALSREGLPIDLQPQDENDEDFFDHQSEINDQYRSSGEFGDDREINDVLNEQYRQSTGADTLVDQYTESDHGHQVHDVGANAHMVEIPQIVESNVASLIEPSTVASSQSFGASNQNLQAAENSFAGRSRDMPEDLLIPRKPIGEFDNASAERWNALKGHAQKLSEDSRESRTDSAQHTPVMGATGMPDLNDPMPDVDHIADDQSDITNPSLHRASPSYRHHLHEPQRPQNRSLWLNESNSPMPPQDEYRQEYEDDEENYDKPTIRDAGVAAAGLGAGAAAAAAAGHHFNKHEDQLSGHYSSREHSNQSLAREQPADDGGHGQYDAYGQDMYDRNAMTPTPTGFKDEGYDTAGPHRSPTPLSFSKPPPLLFDDKDIGKSAQAPVAEDPFTNTARARHISSDSHGMGSPMYDAATGKGLNHIQSKDIVALMDHLTVRDGQRNARDTEILVTLVRSAAEMRNSFDEMKRFIEQQNSINMQRTDTDTDRLINKLFGGSKPPSATNLRSQRSSGTDPEKPVKKKNIFQRALRGLSSRGSDDLERIEDMLMHLLEEMEDLKATTNMISPQPTQGTGGTGQAAMSQARSLDSYERLRAAPESGYEPSGRAGTAASQSGNLTVSSEMRQPHRMHSGYDVNRSVDANRISPVIEHEEEQSQLPREIDEYEEEDGMLTPTQEAQEQRMAKFDTPNSRTLQFKDITPPTPKYGEKSNRHKSNNSSIFPKISRWSKTTASSLPADRMSFSKDRPSSDMSRSGSEINVIPPDDEPYEVPDEDRLKSAQSLPRGIESPGRTPSPLIPSQRNSIEDPKYRAKRHTLDLQHPQPRPGQAPGYQSHLESQANDYRSFEDDGSETTSPNSDVFGGAPSLARMNRMSQQANYRNTLSPISDSGYSARSGDSNVHEAQARKLKLAPPPVRSVRSREDGPLIPQVSNTISNTISNPMSHTSTNDSAAMNSTSSRGARMTNADMSHPAAMINSYDGASEHSSEAGSYNSAADEHNQPLTGQSTAEEDYDNEPWIEPIPLERRRSPYSPGGPLAPIEERYSLEGSVRRSGSNRMAHWSDDEEDLNDFGDVDDRSRTPVNISPAPAISAPNSNSPTVRRITGPREMPPGPARRIGSNGSGGRSSPLRGTVRRKPEPIGSPWD